jgi:hypothetical protein
VKKAAIRFELMTAIKETRAKLDLRKRRENQNLNQGRSSLRRTIPAIPIRPVESSIRLPGSGVDIPDTRPEPAQFRAAQQVGPYFRFGKAMLPTS